MIIKGVVNIPEMKLVDGHVVNTGNSISTKSWLKIIEKGENLQIRYKSCKSSLDNLPETKTVSLEVENEIQTSNWSNGREEWRSISWYGNLGYHGYRIPKSILEEVRLSSCDNFETVFVTFLKKEKDGMIKSVEGYGIFEPDNPTQLQEIYNANTNNKR